MIVSRIALCAAVLAVSACAGNPRMANEPARPAIAPVPAIKAFAPAVKAAPMVQEVAIGQASWYGARFNGRATASGEPFDMNRMTAAHRTLPFGTRVRVTNEGNGRSVIVRVNDRGPFAGERILDLSRAAAEKIGLRSQGVGTVKMEVLSPT